MGVTIVGRGNSNRSVHHLPLDHRELLLPQAHAAEPVQPRHGFEVCLESRLGTFAGRDVANHRLHSEAAVEGDTGARHFHRERRPVRARKRLLAWRRDPAAVDSGYPLERDVPGLGVKEPTHLLAHQVRRRRDPEERSRRWIREHIPPAAVHEDGVGAEDHQVPIAAFHLAESPFERDDAGAGPPQAEHGDE